MGKLVQVLKTKPFASNIDLSGCLKNPIRDIIVQIVSQMNVATVL